MLWYNHIQQLDFISTMLKVDYFYRGNGLFQESYDLFLFLGEIPDAASGIVPATGCINNGRECCIAELPIKVRNCSRETQGSDSNSDGIVVYHLGPTPECNMGYCAGEGLPCPDGLTSENGFTPCSCKDQLKLYKIHTCQV